MTHNFNVKIKTGKRTPIEVTVYYTAVNEKTLQFSHTEKELPQQKVADWISEIIEEGLKKFGTDAKSR